MVIKTRCSRRIRSPVNIFQQTGFPCWFWSFHHPTAPSLCRGTSLTGWQLQPACFLSGRRNNKPWRPVSAARWKVLNHWTSTDQNTSLQRFTLTSNLLSTDRSWLKWLHEICALSFVINYWSLLAKYLTSHWMFLIERLRHFCSYSWIMDRFMFSDVSWLCRSSWSRLAPNLSQCNRWWCQGSCGSRWEWSSTHSWSMTSWHLKCF